MDSIRYKAIRGERDFLFRYFIAMGGKRIPYRTFSQLLPQWLVTRGLDPQKGLQQIVLDLDKRYNYTK